jgi:uncharacterized caspase-like protein
MPTDTTGRRVALLIATFDYRDPALRQLRSPGRDACELQDVLSDPRIGGFDVQTLVNASSGEVQEGIEDFCSDRHPDDQLLIYLSCHGVLDDYGRLYYATANTRRQRLAATAVPAAWLNERLEDCRARRQVVVLDCCHSGAFARASKGDAPLSLQQRFEPHGRGRVVLTASRSTEYSFEGEQPSGEGVPSVFTKAIVEGLATGDADRDRDGMITVTDLYHHLYETVRSAEPRQTPELWTYGAEGDLLVAHSVRGAVIAPAALPEDLRIMLDSPRPRVREAGVVELAGLLDTAGPAIVLTARQALEQIAVGDIERVATLARVALQASPGTAAERVAGELAERGHRERQARAGTPQTAAQPPSDRSRHEPGSPGPRSRPEVVKGQPNRGPPPPSIHRKAAEHGPDVGAQAASCPRPRASKPRGTADDAQSHLPATPPIQMRATSPVTWQRRLVSYGRFWFGLLLVLAGLISFPANVPHRIGWSRAFNGALLNNQDTSTYVGLGLGVVALLGSLLMVGAAISARRASGNPTDQR